MKNYETKEITESKQILTSVTCDRCLKVLEVDFNVRGGGSISFDVGYGSRFDCASSEVELRFDMCDDCIENILNSLKNKAEL